jgi:hypothetical protein
MLPPGLNSFDQATLSMRKYPAARDFGSIAETLLSNTRSDGEAVLDTTDQPYDAIASQNSSGLGG